MFLLVTVVMSKVMQAAQLPLLNLIGATTNDHEFCAHGPFMVVVPPQQTSNAMLFGGGSVVAGDALIMEEHAPPSATGLSTGGNVVQALPSDRLHTWTPVACTEAEFI